MKTGFVLSSDPFELELCGAKKPKDMLGRVSQEYDWSSQNILHSQAYIPQVTSVVLTSHSVHTVNMVRPIDHLVMLLVANPEHFDQFQQKYTLNESMVMLL